MSLPALASLARSGAPGSIRLTKLARLFAEAEEQLSQLEADRHLRREALFAESVPQSLRRNMLALAYSASPKRAAGLLPMWGLLLRDALAPPAGLPDPGSALTDPDGLCGIVRDLSVGTLVEAYSHGLYPWCHAGPLKWWAPHTRCVAGPAEISVGKTARQHARRGTFRFTFDSDFDAVIAACAAPRPGRIPLTWITPKIMWAYARLHDAGIAHSYEVWSKEGDLVAGGYGVTSGRVWIGESMFSRSSGAGAYGFAALHRHLAAWGFALHDAKRSSPHLCGVGFFDMPRDEYVRYLCGHLPASRPGRWHSVPECCTWR